jgi:hypothetical protein
MPENPFANLPISAGTTERERVLSDAEIAEVWAAADRLAYPFGPFFKLAILTLQRREEVTDRFGRHRMAGGRERG